MAEIVGLVTVANDLGTTGSQIKAIATDTKAIAFVLHGFKGRLVKNSRKFDSEAKSVLKETVALCTSEVENMKTHLIPLFQFKEGHRMELKQRARWLFAKSKLSTTKASLDSMKLTLGLLLHTIECIEMDVVEDFVEEKIHEMVATSKQTKEKFLTAQRIDMTIEVIYDRITSHQVPDEGADELPQPPTESHKQTKVGDGVLMTNHHMDLAVFQWESSGIVPGSEHHKVHPDSILPANLNQASLSAEWALIETLPDESFLQIADHIRLHKMVTGFALDTISQPEKNEDYPLGAEQTMSAGSSPQETEERLSERSYQASRAKDIGDNERQEEIPMGSVHIGTKSDVKRPQSRREAQYTATQEHLPSSTSGLGWDDPDSEALKSELAELKLEKQQEAKERQRVEQSIRNDAEREHQFRMEEMQLKIDMQKQIQLAKIEAERRVQEHAQEQAGRREAEERKRLQAEPRSRAEQETIQRKQRQGLRGLISRASKS